MKEETKRKRDAEIKRLAKVLVQDPNATDIVASIFYDNAKVGKKRVDPETARQIAEISEDDDIPMEVLEFLKKRKNIQPFFEYARDQIIDRLISEYFSNELILKFTGFFSGKMLEKYQHACFSQNVQKLMIMVFMEEAGIYYEEEPEWYLKTFEMLFNLSENGPAVLKAMSRMSKFLLDAQGE